MNWTHFAFSNWLCCWYSEGQYACSAPCSKNLFSACSGFVTYRSGQWMKHFNSHSTPKHVMFVSCKVSTYKPRSQLNTILSSCVYQHDCTNSAVIPAEFYVHNQWPLTCGVLVVEVMWILIHNSQLLLGLHLLSAQKVCLKWIHFGSWIYAPCVSFSAFN